MLSIEELEHIGRLKGISRVNAEKDYLQDLLLFGMYSRISDELVFKGGTCLFKIYKLNRFSEDLDFTSRGGINPWKLFSKVISDLELLNVEGRIKEIKRYKNEVNVRMLFTGPLYNGSKESLCFIPINISLKERVVLEPRREMMIPLYREIPNFEVFAMQEHEILAEKIRAILTREKPRDVYDLWFLLCKRGLPFDITLVNKKLRLYNLKFDLVEFMKSIDIKKGLWKLDLQNLILSNLPEFENVREDISKKITTETSKSK
jgi:hypothetical protein